MIKKEYFKILLLYIIPLVFGLSIVSLLKHYIGTNFPYNLMIPKSILLLFIATSFYLIIIKQNYTLTVSILATSMLSASIWMLYGAHTTLGGVNDDNYFNTTMIATFMHTSYSEDFTFTGLSSFYPYYFHYLIAKLGNFFEWTPQQTFKYGAFLIIYISPILTYMSWKKIYNNQESFLMTLGTLFVLNLYMYFNKPYEAISLILIVPWWIYYFDISEKTYKNAIVGGMIGGLLFGIYYYWFFPIVLSSLYLLIINIKNISIKNYIYYLVFAIILMIVASPYLLPYLSDLLRIGSEPFQNRWFTPDHLDFPLQKITSIKEFLLLIGLIYLIISKKRVAEKHLLVVLLASYIWIFLGHMGIINDTPLLHTHISIFITLILCIGFILFIQEVIIRLQADYNIKATITFAILIFTMSPFFVSLSHHYNSEYLLAAKNFKVPHCIKDEKLIKMLTGKTILADRSTIFKLNPYLYIHFFTEIKSYYAHPSSLTSQRLDFILMLSKSKNKKFIKWILQNNKFSKIEYVWLNKKIFTTSHDNFPNLKHSQWIKIQFKEDFFSSLSKVNGYKYLYKVSDTNTSIRYNKLDPFDKSIYNKFSKNSPNIREIYDIEHNSSL